MTFRLSKLHGLGNDFLVLLTDDVAVAGDAAWPARAVAWCERHRGIGADGLIVGAVGAAATSAGADVVMHLFNADGSRAEISGNGIRCLAHAEARRSGRFDGPLAVATDGGIRQIELHGDPGRPDVIHAAVDMGEVGKGPSPDQALLSPYHDGAHGVSLADRLRAGLDGPAFATYDLGNPHLVLRFDDPDLVDIAVAGPVNEAAFSAGINVHVLSPTPGETDAITLKHWERGVGVTEACGSGASVSAYAARQFGLVGDHVTVHMPGGDAEVLIGETLVLRGPSVFIADIEVPA